MGRRHFHVTVGMCGYLPELASAYRTLTDARAGAAEEARKFREDIGADDTGRLVPYWRVSGSARAGSYRVTRRRATRPSWYIEIGECTDSECWCTRCNGQGCSYCTDGLLQD